MREPYWYIKKANSDMIKQELKNYHATKKRIIDLIKEVLEEAEDIAYPKASGGNIGYIILHYTENGRKSTKIIYDFLRHGGGTSDPTFNKVQEVMKLKAGSLTSLSLAEMARRIDAIDSVIEELEKKLTSLEPNIQEEAKNKLIILKEKYLGKDKVLNDEGIARKINSEIATFYRLQKKIIESIAEILGWAV